MQNPERLPLPLAFLDIDQGEWTSNTWWRDPDRVRRVVERLDSPPVVNADCTMPWAGIGEIHVMADQRNEPVLHELVREVERRELALTLHGDPVVIDRVFELAPTIRVVWAHAGTFAHPDLLRNYLRRYPRLHVDLSMRAERIRGDGGTIDPEWDALFFEYPERFFIGSDPFSRSRWERIEFELDAHQRWLDALPEDLEKAIAAKNARVFLDAAHRAADACLATRVD